MNPNVKDNLRPFKKGFDERRNIKGQPMKLDNVMAAAVTDEDKIQIASKQMEKAKAGELRSAEFVFGYLFGKPKQATEITGKDGEPLMPVQIVFRDFKDE